MRVYLAKWIQGWDMIVLKEACLWGWVMKDDNISLMCRFMQGRYTHKKEINKKLFSKADSLVDKILFCPRIKQSNSQTLILNGVETGFFLLDFAQQLRRKNADVPNVYFTLLDAACIAPSLILNQNAKAIEKRSWVPFKIWTSEAEKAVHTGCCWSWVCAQLSES